MKMLVAYYSSTGNTEKLAKGIARILSAKGNKVDIERIAPLQEYGSNLEKYIFGGFGAALGARRAIAKPSRDASKYDLFALGSPVWGGKPAPPVNAYIDLISGPGKKAFVFVSSGGPRNKDALEVLASRLSEKGFRMTGKFGVWKGMPFDEEKLKAALKKAI